MRAMLLVVLLAGTGAWAFQLRKDDDGHSVRWAQTVTFAVDPGLPSTLDAPSALDAVRATLDSYRRVLPRLNIALSDDPSLKIGYDLSTVVQENAIAVPPTWPFQATAIAVTVITVDDSSHRIVDADIALNPDRKFRVLPPQGDFGAPYDDIQNTLTHEVGHVLGLAHNPDDPSAVMYPTAAAGEISKRTLSDDDLAALRALYGGPMDAGCDATGAPGALPILLLIGVVLVAIRPRGTRQPRPTRAASVGVLLLTFTLLGARKAESRPLAVEPVPVAPLRSASEVAMGHVLAVRTLPPRASGPQLFFSKLTVSVDRCLKGSCPERLTLTVPGGRIGHLEQWVADSPVPAAGATVGLSVTEGAPRLFDQTRPEQAEAFTRGLEQAGLSR